jgi:hypothetical protein
MNSVPSTVSALAQDSIDTMPKPQFHKGQPVFYCGVEYLVGATYTGKNGVTEVELTTLSGVEVEWIPAQALHELLDVEAHPKPKHRKSYGRRDFGAGFGLSDAEVKFNKD